MISRGLRAARATAALVFIFAFLSLNGFRGATLKHAAPGWKLHEYRIFAARSARHRLPDREGNHHPRSVSTIAECPHQRLQPENQPRAGAGTARSGSPAD